MKQATILAEIGIAPRKALELETLSRVIWRLVPFLCLAYFFCFLDRVNIGFAGIAMNAQLGFTATVFGFGTGLFFIGYVLFEIPSNLALRRFGARRWIGRIMVTWGVMSAATAFVWDEWSFYAIRFLLGAAEAGLLPGVMLYLTYWIPAENRARVLGLFMVAIAFSGVIGAPLSAFLFKLDGIAGLAGWQWMFLIEAVPSIFMGIASFWYLTDRPSEASWLGDDAKRWLESHLAEQEAQRQKQYHLSLFDTFVSPKVWSLGLVNFGLLVGLYTINFWMPQIIQENGTVDTMTIGLLAALPSLVGACGMVLWSRHSDLAGERTWHLAIPMCVAVGGFAAASVASTPTAVIILLIVAALGIHAALPIFWTLPTAFLSGISVASGLALINSISNLGGYVGPYMMGVIKDRTQSFSLAFAIIAAILAATIVIVFAADAAWRRHRSRLGGAKQ